MRSYESESILLMQILDVVHDPIHGGMAASAVVAHTCRVNVRMAGRTIHGRSIEDEGSMARLAIHLRMCSFQWKIR